MNGKLFHFVWRILGTTIVSIAVFDKNFDYWLPINPEWGTKSWIHCLFIHLGIWLVGLAVFVFDHSLSRREKLQQRVIRPFTLNMVLVFTSLLTPVTFCELFLRNVTFLIQKDVSLFQKDEALGWRLRPNAQSRAGAPVRINRHGLRGPDRNFQKREGVQRILFLGDSIPFGLRVPYDDTFPNMVEVAMNQGSGATVECINAGIPGYSTWQEYLFFEREACRYEPDVVVLSFCLNDVLHTYTGLRFGDYGVDDPVPYIEENFIDYLTRRSAILRAGKSLYHRVAFGKTLKENAIYREGLDVAALFQKADYPEIRQAWIDVKHYIQKIADRCAREKAQFILALFPYIVPISATGIVVYSPRPIAEYAQQMEYPYIDVLPLIERDMEKQGIHRFRHYIQDACHPSAHGNRLAAEALVQLLLQPSLSDAADTRKNPPTHPGVY